MPRKEQGWITFQSSEEERQILEQYCKQSQRTKTEILRQLVRGLNQPLPQEQTIAPESAPQPPHQAHLETHEKGLELKFSARNVLPGKIKRVIKDAVNAEITLEIAPGIDLISIITTASAEKLALQAGKEVYAVIKSNSVMIARV